MFKATDLFVEKNPEENPDWGHARTTRIILRRPECELVQSTHSVHLGNFMAPNRDYPHEGLSAVIEGTNWKFLDSIAFSLEAGGAVELKPLKVTVHPHKTVYRYATPLGKELLVEYYLFRKTKNPLLCVSFLFPGEGIVRARPFADVREINSPAKGVVHVFEKENSLTVQSGEKEMRIYSPNALNTTVLQFSQHWRYKLGSGERREEDGMVVFNSEERMVECVGEIVLELRKGLAELFVACGPAGADLVDHGLKKHDEQLELARTNRLLAARERELGAAEEKWGRERAGALAARLVCLVEKSWLREGIGAGSLWFRENWLRDAFEGILANFPIYYASRKRDLKRIILAAHSLQRNGLVPTRAAPEPAHDSIDATLLCMLCSLEYLKREGDKAIASAAEKTFHALEASALRGGDFYLSAGLLASRANWSWTDSVKTIDGIRVPLRLPNEWISEAMKRNNARKLLEGPNYFLAEINALWIKLLKTVPQNWFPSTSGDEAGKEFKKKFWDGKALAHVWCGEFGAALEPSSHAVQAASLLPELFDKQELSLVKKFVEPLIVRRGEKIFGILTRSAGRHFFLGDDEYHQRVLWPRETVYLIKLLDLLGDKKGVEELLLSNLDHQEEEGAVHYCHELFSLPEGGNPSPAETSSLPVPVKNPAQYWSQWVQPYFDFLAGGT